MGKNMARLDENNVVINIEWCSINTPETDILKEIHNYPVSPGDTYNNGLFYNNGNRLLTETEYLYSVIEEYENEKNELIDSYTNGVNSI